MSDPASAIKRRIQQAALLGAAAGGLYFAYTRLTPRKFPGPRSVSAAWWRGRRHCTAAAAETEPARSACRGTTPAASSRVVWAVGSWAHRTWSVASLFHLLRPAVPAMPPSLPRPRRLAAALLSANVDLDPWRSRERREKRVSGN
jgi:hypothetical protein